jgi:hypothetical protein
MEAFRLHGRGIDFYEYEPVSENLRVRVGWSDPNLMPTICVSSPDLALSRSEDPLLDTIGLSSLLGQRRRYLEARETKQ